jgi:hypothetical protein
MHMKLDQGSASDDGLSDVGEDLVWAARGESGSCNRSFAAASTFCFVNPPTLSPSNSPDNSTRGGRMRENSRANVRGCEWQQDARSNERAVHWSEHATREAEGRRTEPGFLAGSMFQQCIPGKATQPVSELAANDNRQLEVVQTSGCGHFAYSVVARERDSSSNGIQGLMR